MNRNSKGKKLTAGGEAKYRTIFMAEMFGLMMNLEDDTATVRGAKRVPASRAAETNILSCRYTIVERKHKKAFLEKVEDHESEPYPSKEPLKAHGRESMDVPIDNY